MDYTPLSEREEEIGRAIVEAAYKIHRGLDLGCWRACMKFVSAMN